MLPPCSPQRSWRTVPDADPNGRTISFPVVYNDLLVPATGIAYDDEIALYPIASQRIEIQREVFQQVSTFLTIAAHSR